MGKIASLIVACDKNYLIGNNDKLPWNLPADLAYFKKTTLNYPVIMGKITFESILGSLGKPLPDRKNIILTRSEAGNVGGVFFVNSLDEAIKTSDDSQNVFIIGGASVYRQSLERGMIDRIYLTLIDSEFKGNIYFPKEFLRDFKEISRKNHKKDEANKYDMRFIVLEKR